MDSVNTFETIVAEHYEALFKFAFSLARSESDACDLTQQTFYVWAKKGDQLRDPTKAKTWLFTTLHRAFLQTKRKESRFSQQDFEALASGRSALRKLGLFPGIVCAGGH